MLKWLATVVEGSESSTRTRAGTRTLEHGFKAGASSNIVTMWQRHNERLERNVLNAFQV